MADAKLNKKLRQAARKGRVDDIKRLLDAGADIETRGGFFSLAQTPVGIAAWHGHAEAVRVLLERGAQPDVPAMGGTTPLIDATLFGHTQIVALLLAKGADPTRVDPHSGRSVHEAAVKGGNPAVIALVKVALDARAKKQDEERRKILEEASAKLRKAETAEREKQKDLVTYQRPFGDRTLEETFNFATRERITLLRRGAGGPVEAMTRESFSVIDDRAALHAAFDDYAKKGGSLKERDVFPDEMPKIKQLRGPT